MKKHSWQRMGMMYLGIGVLNTALGYGVIFLMLWCGVMAEVANLIGYMIGFILSYYLNKTFTFASLSSHKRDLPRFGFAMGVAYIAQLLVMIFVYRFLEYNPYLAQVLSGIIYVCVGFIISKCWSFAHP